MPLRQRARDLPRTAASGGGAVEGNTLLMHEEVEDSHPKKKSRGSVPTAYQGLSGSQSCSKGARVLRIVLRCDTSTVHTEVCVPCKGTYSLGPIRCWSHRNLGITALLRQSRFKIHEETYGLSEEEESFPART